MKWIRLASTLCIVGTSDESFSKWPEIKWIMGEGFTEDSFTSFTSTASLHTKSNLLSSLVKWNVVKQETSHEVILCPTVSVPDNDLHVERSKSTDFGDLKFKTAKLFRRNSNKKFVEERKQSRDKNSFLININLNKLRLILWLVLYRY